MRFPVRLTHTYVQVATCKHARAGTIFVGASSGDAALKFFPVAQDVMLTRTGVDLGPLVFRGMFVFAAELGKPEKATYELRDNSPPYYVLMSVLIKGLLSVKDTRISSVCTKKLYYRRL